MGITIQNDGTKEKTKEHYKGKVRVNAPITIPMEYTTFQGKVPSLVYKVFHDIYLNMFTSHAISLRTSFTDECFACLGTMTHVFLKTPYSREIARSILLHVNLNIYS